MELSVSPTARISKSEQNVTPQCGSTASSVKKTLFTPCRQQGLKRKGSGTPITPGSSAVSSTRFKNHRHSFETPKRTISFPNIDQSPATSVLSPTIGLSVGSINATKDVSPQIDVQKRGSQLLRKRIALHKNVSQTDDLVECDRTLTHEMLQQLQKQVNDKEEQLNKLKHQQSVLRKGQDTLVLLQRTEKWRTGCQDALQQLHEKTLSLGHQVTMADMITQLRIPFNLVNFDPNLEDFIDK